MLMLHLPFVDYRFFDMGVFVFEFQVFSDCFSVITGYGRNFADVVFTAHAPAVFSNIVDISDFIFREHCLNLVHP